MHHSGMTTAGKDYATEWKRTQPDLTVYRPATENGFDSVNQHFLVIVSPAGAWLAFWTRSADEGQANQHVVCSRSEDYGRTWDAPRVIDGPAGGTGGMAPDQSQGSWHVPEVEQDNIDIASWGFPIVVGRRIHFFYSKNTGKTDFRYDMSGVLRMRFSDDDGRTWSAETHDYAVADKAIDNPDPAVNKNWIVWQVPCRTAGGMVIAPYTRWSSPKCHGAGGSESFFFRFENIQAELDPGRLVIRTHPETPHGLTVPSASCPANSYCEEPAVAGLSDGRIFCVMRTALGVIFWSVSGDDGRTWSTPAPLLDRPGGRFLLNPVSPCPIYRMRDGRFLLLYYNNDGSANGGKVPAGYKYFRNNRYPAFITVGRERLDDPVQPLHFGPPKRFATSDGVPIGPGARTSVAAYPSLLEDGDRRVLFYPDRKHFLLGRHLTDDWLAECDPDA